MSRLMSRPRLDRPRDQSGRAYANEQWRRPVLDPGRQVGGFHKLLRRPGVHRLLKKAQKKQGKKELRIHWHQTLHGKNRYLCAFAVPHRISIEEFEKRAGDLPVVDVRAPAEFAHGHIPGAVNIALFSDEQRARVGTTYKREGKEAAILLGFDLTGPKWAEFIRQALLIAPQKKLALHCWRGGMRSSAMAWAFDLYGFDVSLLQGGYKNYRRWTARQWERPYTLNVIGGNTGSGKTKILGQLKVLGGQTIDLEDLAQHQGSTYGSLNRLIQPTQEQFENDLATTLAGLDSTRPIWIEDESLNIGK